MQVVLWNTRRRQVTKDYSGGLGVGMFPGRGGLRAWLVRRAFTRDHRPVALNFAYLAALFRERGHEVRYCLDRVVPSADLHVFNPAMVTLGVERDAIRRLQFASPQSKILVVGSMAHVVPEAFADLNVTVVRGEPEQLYWKLEEVLNSGESVVDLGTVADLDALPWPDWTPFRPQRFRIAYDFWKFPTAFIYQSRGCSLSCNYCPYIILQNKTRFRDPDQVVGEILYGMRRYGFRSFKFRDPLFGLDRKRVERLAEGIGGLPRRIQFSIETRLDVMKPDLLSLLASVGLTSITVGIERPDSETLRRHRRAPIREDRQRAFITQCREMGIRVVAGFIVGFPDDTRESILEVLDYARKLNPTFANFNVLTPYPGTDFYEQIRGQIADFDLNQYSIYTPIMKYRYLTRQDVSELNELCFTKYYFRLRYYRENLRLLFPVLRRFGVNLKSEGLGARQRQANGESGSDPDKLVRQAPGIQLQKTTDTTDGPSNTSQAAA